MKKDVLPVRGFIYFNEEDELRAYPKRVFDDGTEYFPQVITKQEPIYSIVIEKCKQTPLEIVEFPDKKMLMEFTVLDNEDVEFKSFEDVNNTIPIFEQWLQNKKIDYDYNILKSLNDSVIQLADELYNDSDEEEE